MADLTTIILTHNEEKNIANAINSIKNISKRIIVIDSYSTDKTVEIAKQLGAEVIQHEFINQAKQFIYAINILNISTQWIMRLDADEIISVDASREIEEICKQNKETDINGIIVRFEVVFLGKKLRHGGIYPFKKMIVYKKDKGYMENRDMDEHIVLAQGKSIELKSDSYHQDYKDLYEWIDKHNKYSNREVNDYYNNQNSVNHQLNKSAKVKRLIKINIYYKLPMGIRSHLYFWYRYYIKFGFLDGKEGKIFTFLQAYWYRFLVDAKIYEKNKKDK